MMKNYRRAPLPEEVKVLSKWLIMFSLLLIFSPFIGFSINGKVDERGLVYGLAFSTIPLLVITVLIFRRWRKLRHVPKYVLK
jgi:uncharacterized membrane protein